MSARGRRSPESSIRWANGANRFAASGHRWPAARAVRRIGPTARVTQCRHSMAEFAEHRRKLGPDRNGDFRRRGRRRRTAVGGEIDQRGIRFMTDRRDQGDRQFGRGAHHFLLIEGPKVLDRSSAPRDDQQIGPRLELGETADCGGDLFRCPLALHRDGPDDHMGRAAVFEAVEDVADDGPGRRCDHADHARQERKPALLRLVEQPFGGERPAALVQQGHQRALAGKLHPVDHDLVLGPPGISGELAGRDDLGAVLRPEGEARRLPFPDDRVDARRFILQREVTMPRCVPLPA